MYSYIFHVSSTCTYVYVRVCLCVCERVYVITGKNKLFLDVQSILFLILYEENYENESL